MLLIDIAFWLSIDAIFYTFIGYPIILWVLSIFIYRPAKNQRKSALPTVSLLISAYNEEKAIEEKLDNSLELNYPKDKLEVIVVSDASTDKTDEKVKRFSDKGVRLIRQAESNGKTAALNIALPQSQGDIVIFSDANSIYHENAVKELVKNFDNPAIGCVSGRTKYISRQGNAVAESTGLYTKMEIMTKFLESRVTSCVGADGAIFAIRKNLFMPLKAYDINDLVIPLNIIEQGYCAILEKDAFCVEETAKDTTGEFNRQVRITCRTIRAILNHKTLLNPLKYPLFSFALFSHKIVKFLFPVFLPIVFLSNLILLTSGTIYLFLGLLQIFFYLLFVYGYLERKKKKRRRLSNLAFTFGTVCLAFFLGWFKYFSGETYTTWSSERQKK